MNNAAALYQAALETQDLGLALQALAQAPTSPAVKALVKHLKRNRGSRA